MTKSCKKWYELFDEDEFCYSNRTAVSEKGKTYRLKTQSSVCCIRLDNCLIKNDSGKEDDKKCDYLMIENESERFIFIELKGKHVDRAVMQIKNSIKEIKKKFNRISKKNIMGRIVASSISKTVRTNMESWKDEFAKNHGKNLLIKNIKLEESF